MWTPISLTELKEWISRGESKLDDEPLNFWNLIKIAPQKWKEKEYGDEGGGFWVVAVFGNTVVFYNDIEDGFNTSPYTAYGQISEYASEQAELDWIVERLYNSLKRNAQL
ncbi:hypothetical protein [Pedobacter duraquae]|uniref:Uncharacterized protein n=1 Tax=Pedobacter duraquae TaxID=425511 RepID=A0A4R6INI7_9SPHI|nr:hypothetical protein [Pedobacter duraquae]TDO23773.1 hypothetical protein CLV32_0058 [Pedobacter duraquae]